MKSIAIKNAFPGGAHGACWLDDDRIASAGADGTVKIVSRETLSVTTISYLTFVIKTSLAQYYSSGCDID